MSDGEKTFSEAQVADMRRKYDSQVSEAASKATSKLLADLGYDDAESLQGYLSEQRDKAEAGKTDLEKAQREIKKLQLALEKEATAHASTRQAWHGRSVQSAVLAAAAEVKANDPEDFFYRLKEVLVVDDSGDVVGPDGKSVADLVAGLAKDKPHLVQASGGDGASSQPGSEPNNKPDLTTAEGRIAHLAAQGVKF